MTSPEFGTVTATDRLPETVSIIEAVLVSGAEAEEGSDAEGRMRLRFQDPGGRKNFYHPIMLADLASGLRPVSYTTPEQHAEDELFDRLDFVSSITGDRNHLVFRGLYMDDVRFDGGIGEVTNACARTLSNGYTAGLEIMSESYYRYIRSLMILEENRGNPFAEPARVFSNVEGGIGIFAGSRRAPPWPRARARCAPPPAAPRRFSR